jgi:flagellar basal body-associated protein FliL
MATLNDVKKLTNSGKKKEAAKALQQLLREKPSADAWYYASTLAKTADAKKKYLQKALAMNPRHDPSNKMLKQLEGNAPGTPKKKNTGRGGASTALIGIIVVLVIAVLGIAGFFLFTPNSPAQVDEGNTDPETVLQGDTTVDEVVEAVEGITATGPVVGHFQVSGLIAGALDTTEGSGVQQQIEFELNGQEEPAVLKIYASVEELSDNREALFEATRGATVMLVQQNAVLLYPISVDSQSSQTLRETLRTMPLN